MADALPDFTETIPSQDIVSDSQPKVEDISLDFFTILISFLALAVSLLTLWKNHLAPFKVKTSFEAPTFSLYKITPSISGGSTTWWLPSFDMGFTFYNLGSRPGEIVDLRLQMELETSDGIKTYPFYPQWIVDYPIFNKDGHDRMKWLRTAVIKEWYPFFIAGNSQVIIHVVLEGHRWDERINANGKVVLEVYTSQKNRWEKLATYPFYVHEESFDDKSKHTLADQNLSKSRVAGYGNWYDRLEEQAGD